MSKWEIDADWEAERDKALEEWNQIEELGRQTLSVTKVSMVSEVSSIFECQPSCSFQSIWTKLTAEDLAHEKEIAQELISKADASTSQSSSAGLPRCFRRFSTPSKCVLRNSTLVDERLTIVALTKVKYSEENATHWEMLNAVYKYLSEERGSKGDVARIGSHWETIGFQGDDPATDLRGVGVFGLCQLLFLASNGLSAQMIKQLRELSNDPIQSFPLCVVGLTWTQMIVERLKKGKLNRLAVKENSFISVVNGIYRGCFLEFLTLWRVRRCTIVDFCKISAEIRRSVKQRPKHLLNMAILNKG